MLLVNLFLECVQIVCPLVCLGVGLSKSVSLSCHNLKKHGKARSLSQTTSTAPFSLAGYFLHLLCNSEKGKKKTVSVTVQRNASAENRVNLNKRHI